MLGLLEITQKRDGVHNRNQQTKNDLTDAKLTKHRKLTRHPGGRRAKTLCVRLFGLPTFFVKWYLDGCLNLEILQNPCNYATFACYGAW